MLTVNLYEAVGVLAPIAAAVLILRVRRSDTGYADTLISIGLVGLFFGFSWEPQGTDLVWSYPGFNLYAFMGVPAVIIFSWSWWMMLAYMVSKRVSRLLGRVHTSRYGGFTTKLAYFVSGVISALIIETTAVFYGWWEYLVVGDRAVVTIPLINVQFNLAVVLGWGILTTINLTFATVTVKALREALRGFNLGHYASLALSSISLGLVSGWASWQLIALLAALLEGASPRIFFTREVIFTLDWISSAQLSVVLIILSVIAVSVNGRRRSSETTLARMWRSSSGCTR